MSAGPRADRAFSFATAAAAVVLLAVLGALVTALLIEAWPALRPSVLGGPPSSDLTRGGIAHAAYGTALTTILMTLAVVPVGVATAVHLSEYARPDSLIVRAVRSAVRTLAAVPSIVFGLFGLGFFVLFVGRGIDSVAYADAPSAVFGRPAILWASLTLAVLTLPVVIVTSEEALRSVPRELREASHALGATKLQTVFHVVLPGARAGILTGAILATSRGAGEVAAVLFTGVASYMPTLPTDLRDGFMHLGYHAYVLATQAPDVEHATPVLFASALILVFATVGLNLIALVLRDRSRGRA